MSLDQIKNMMGQVVNGVVINGIAQIYSALVVGDNVVLAGQIGKQIHVFGLILSTDGGGIITIANDSGSNQIPIVAVSMNTTGGVWRQNTGSKPLFATNLGSGLNFELGTAPTASASVYLQYAYV